MREFFFSTDLQLVIGGFLLLWALAAARRSGFDALILAIGGLILLFRGLLRWISPDFISEGAVGMIPEVALVPICGLLFVRAFSSPLSGIERVGLGLFGVLLLLPALLGLAWLVLLI